MHERAGWILLLPFLLWSGCGGSSGGGGGGAPAGAAPLTTNVAAQPGPAAGGPAATPTPAPQLTPLPIPGVRVAMDYSGSAGFYGAPFPDEALRDAGGAVDVSAFPNPGSNGMVQAILDAIGDVDGFGTTSGIFFQLDDTLDPARFPDLHATVAPTSPVFLMSVEAGAPDYQERYPVEVRFQADGGPFGAPNLLSLLPLQGVPLREGTLYAAAVLRTLGDATGQPLGVPLPMAQLAAGVQPAGLSPAAFQAHQQALDALRASGIDPGHLAGIAVFRTGHPTRGLETFRQDALQQPLPQPLSPLTRVAVHPEFSVFRSTVRMPVYQNGTPPFLAGGGGWLRDAGGQPIRQGFEEANLFVTVPRAPMPPGGFPAVVMVRTGFGNGEDPIVTRGRHPAPGAPAAPGSGPAQEFARAGFMGIQVDGPHGGRRNVTGMDEQFLMFNAINPIAMRDNVRQSALELVLLGEALGSITLDPADCPDVTTLSGAQVSIDLSHVALFGHSMGATIAPLVLASQPRYQAAILSGAGGSWIENLVFKQSPMPARPMAETILGYLAIPRNLTTHDPILSMLQWAGESADPPTYSRFITREPRQGAPRHVLMVQGVVDTYILPSIANATSLSLGLDLAGVAHDVAHPLLTQFRPLSDLLPLSGGARRSLPIGGNRAQGASTAVVVQHPQDGIEDGHEVIFQVDPAKAQYRSFLSTWVGQGVPQVP